MLTPERIKAHNAEVRAFRDKMQPLIEGLTDEQCQLIVDAGLNRGLSMNRIAIEMREEVGGDWDSDYDVGVGMMLYRHALERLDEYDADFRPRPERLLISQEDGYEVHYLTSEGEFEVVVNDVSERFRASYRPKFGMDIGDAATAADVAIRLKASVR